jgi:hypothetical protein
MHRCTRVSASPLAAEQPTGRANFERQQRSLWDDPSQTVRGFERQHTTSLTALAHEDLDGLTGCVTQRRGNRSSDVNERKAIGRQLSERDQTMAEFEATRSVASKQAVRFQCARQTVRRGPRESG